MFKENSMSLNTENLHSLKFDNEIVKIPATD